MKLPLAKSLPALLLPLALLPSMPLHAQERILAYDSMVVVQPDGGLDVTEAITVRAEGDQVRRGIYRDFPTRYKDRYGNRVVVDFEMLGVTRDGKPEPWFTEDKANGVRINTGNDDLLPVPADHAYVLHYRTTRQLGFFPDHDELYWNAIGTGWAFPIERAEAVIQLPPGASLARTDEVARKVTAIVLDIEPATVARQNAERARVVDDEVIERHLAAIRQTVDTDVLPSEGFDNVVILRTPADARGLTIDRRPTLPQG